MSAADVADPARASIEAILSAADKKGASEAIAAIHASPEIIDGLRALRVEDSGEWQAILARLGAVKGISRAVSSLRKVVEAEGPKLRVAGEDEPPQLPPWAPEGYRVPDGYLVDWRGIFKVEPDGACERVTMAPILVTGRMVDVDSGQHAVELSWPGWGKGRCVREVVPSVVVSDARALIQLSALGAPVTSANSGRLVEYIDASRSYNEKILPLGLTAQRMGWMEDGFLLGDRWIGKSDREVLWRGGEGEAQLAEAFREEGTFSEWVKVLEAAGRSPAAWLVIYAAVASVVLEPVGASDGAAMDLSGETTKGKTTLMRLAASIMGKPGLIIRAWSATYSGIESYCSTLHNLAPCLDDTKKAGKRETVADVLYIQSGGVGKMRGRPGSAGQGVGMRRAETWKSLLISTGEERATSFTQDAGARARTLCLIGDPLESREQADRIAAITSENYGHLLPRVVRFLCDDASRAEMASHYQKARKHWSDQLGQYGAVAGRLGDIVAILEIAKMICERVGMPAPKLCDPINYAADCAAYGGADADRPLAALASVYEWAASRQGFFFGRHQDEDVGKVPQGGWCGAWKGDGAASKWEWIGFTTSALTRALVEAGYDRSNISGLIERWRERGWLAADDGRMQRKARIQGVPTNLYCLSREALMLVGAE